MLQLILFAAALSQSSAAPTEYRVLLVGLGPYAEQGTGLESLTGSTDVKTFRSALTTYFKIPDSATAIHELDDVDATKERIEAEFKNWLVKGAGPNRSMIFYFSGHGTMTLDRTQKLCSAIVPIDVKRITPGGTLDSASLVSRDFFNNELRELRGAKATNITLVFDACDSGLVARGTAISKSAVNPGLQIPNPSEQDALPTDLDFGDAAVIAAAKIGRSAWQNYPAGGNLTVALARAMKDHAEANSATTALSYAELQDRAMANLAALNQPIPQEPVFVVSNPTRAVFGTSSGSTQPAYRVVLDNSAASGVLAPDPNALPTFVMMAGAALGIQENFTLGIWPIGAALQGPPKVTATVVRVDPTTSWLTFANPADLSWLKAGGRARIIDGTPDARVNFDFAAATGPNLAAFKNAFTAELTPLVRFDPKGANCVHLVPPGGSAVFPNATGGWLLCDGGGNPIYGGQKEATADPDSLAIWAEEAVRDFGRRQALLALNSPAPWVNIDMDIVPVETSIVSGKEVLTRLKPNTAAGTSTDVRGDGTIRLALRIRARWSDGAVDTPDDEQTIGRRPHIALVEVTPLGKVHLAYPDPGLPTSSDKQRLPVTGQWFYIGNRNDLLAESSLTTPDAIANVGGWSFDPKDGIGHDVIRLLATDADVDFTPLMSRSRGPAARGGESALGRILTAYRNGQPVSRGQQDPEVQKFAVTDVSFNVLAVGG